jgi:hypothetical protein
MDFNKNIVSIDLKILSYGIQQYFDSGFARRGLWVRANEVAGPIVVCVNGHIMTNTVLSEADSIITTDLPRGLHFVDGKIAVQLLNVKTGTRSNLVFLDNIQSALPEDNKGQHILISCFPKSGSTLLLRLLTKATGFLNWPLVYEYGGNEQDLYFPSVVNGYSIDTVTQQHVRATKANIRIISDFGFQVIVLTRNIFDTLVSLHDHLIQESFETPLLYVDSDFESMSFERRIDMLIDLALPWYLDHYASWFKNDRVLDNNSVYWLSYEELINKPVETVKSICNHFHIPFLENFAELHNIASSAVNTRLNVGTAGRGTEMLSTTQKNRVIEMMRHHYRVDFSKLL